MERYNVLLGSPNEELVGFSRAVRVGSFICVGGTAPIGEDGETVGVGDITLQAERCFEIIQQSLERIGASLADVVRTRIMLTDLSQVSEVVAVRRAYVGAFKPVDTIVQVGGFMDPEWLIEVEADAIVAE